MDRLKAFLFDDSGATAIEYGLIVSLIAIGLIGGLTIFSDSLSLIFTTVSERITVP
ncbi:Flp family type IVb pilin [Shinella daejeonensis]|uniref:Flp family type IVb pilin n=1 Tax=Shinella daejeonensis TaxID=659017 RepID=UPI0020C79381|nr:Flp family type IVb pilin [Shinella daejeonensis]MCP8896008.1 Flp family type IVb pilin [Shinella daejeonensis]